MIRFTSRALPRRIAPLLTLVGATAVVFSCGGDSPTAPAPKPTAIAFTTDPDSITVGDSGAIGVRFTDAQNHTLTAGPTLAWTSSDTSVVRMTGATAHAVKLGSAIVTATGGGLSASLTVVVRPIPVQRIVAPAGSRTVMEGDTASAAPGLVLIDQHGDTVSGRTVTFVTSNAAIVTVDPTSGLLHGVAAGSASVVVQVDGATLSIPVTVTPAPVASVHVIPSSVYLPPGKVWHLTPSAVSPAGGTLGNRTFTYSSSNPAVATVSSSGALQGVSTGTTTVQVTSSGVTSNVPVYVSATGPGGFSIDVRSYGAVNQAVLDAAKAAAARWATVITTPLVPYPVVGAEADSGICGPGVPAVHETVPNVIVFITTDSIDGRGNVAAQGGPCIYRNDAPQLTVVGTIEVDKSDVSSIQSAGVLTDLLMHEMGHVLGIGSLWFPDFQAVPASSTTTGLGGSDPRFIGATARGASAALGFTTDSSLGVPIENTGGTGTKDAHWRATVFGRELMTGTLHNDSNPLSLVTIRALQDMGYGVAPSAADEFTELSSGGTGGVSAQLNAGGRAIDLNDVVLRPRFSVTKSGHLRPVSGSATGTRAPK